MLIDLKDVLAGPAPLGPLAGTTVTWWRAGDRGPQHLHRDCPYAGPSAAPARIAFPAAGGLDGFDLQACDACVERAATPVARYLRDAAGLHEEHLAVRALGRAVLAAKSGAWLGMVELDRRGRGLAATASRCHPALAVAANDLHRRARRLLDAGLARNATPDGERALLRPLAAALLAMPPATSNGHGPIPHAPLRAVPAKLRRRLDGRLGILVDAWFGMVSRGRGDNEAEQRLTRSIGSSAPLAALLDARERRQVAATLASAWRDLVAAELDAGADKPPQVVALRVAAGAPAPWLAALFLRYRNVEVAPRLRAAVMPDVAARWIESGLAGVRARLLGPVGTPHTAEALAVFTESARTDLHPLHIPAAYGATNGNGAAATARTPTKA